MIEKVWVLTGSSELYYEDTELEETFHWIVAVYTTPEEAEHHKRLLDSKLKGRGNWGAWSTIQKHCRQIRKVWDKNIIDGYGIIYKVIETEFVRHPDEYLERRGM